MNVKSKKIRAVIFEEKDLGWWSAQCLEHDIAVQAKSLNDLLYELERVIVGHVVVGEELNLKPVEHLSPAPAKFWQLYDQSNVHIERKGPYPFDFALQDVRVAQLQCT